MGRAGDGCGLRRRHDGLTPAPARAMRIVIGAVGRLAASRPEAALYDHFARRISFALILKEVAAKGRASAALLRRREGALLLAAVPAGAIVVALDAGGTALTSARLAARLGAWRDAGVRDLAFLIGGAEGLDRALLDNADLVLSLGAMTWPHLLVRAMLAEQLYRAQCILEGHPYHRR